jgi:hypothetical protein
MPISDNDRLVTFDGSAQKISIWRVIWREDGAMEKSLYTECSCDNIAEMGIEEFSRLLGENILIDMKGPRERFFK